MSAVPGVKITNAVLAALPSTGWFLLSTLPCAQAATSDLTDCGELTGTGYARQSQPVPALTDGLITFEPITWQTATATDWSWATQTLLLATTGNNTGSIVYAWDLGGQDLSHPGDQLIVTPILDPTGAGGSVDVIHQAA